VPFSAWLYRVAINECNQFFRQSKKSRTIVLDDEFSKLLIDELVDENNIEDNYTKLGNCIKKLKIEEVHLLQLRYYENKSFREVGYILDTTENNAKVKLYRLLDKMKIIITELR